MALTTSEDSYLDRLVSYVTGSPESFSKSSNKLFDENPIALGVLISP